MNWKKQLVTALGLILSLLAARPAQAQTETVLWNFGVQPGDGDYLFSRLTSDGAGNFYGATYGGGTYFYGTVFELSPNGSGGWNETVLYSFTGGADGRNPSFSYVMFDSAGNLYGTTYYGGANGGGVVFELSPLGTSWTETVLYSFTGLADGDLPVNGLIMDAAGNLYGKTSQGGEYSDGTVFELTPSGGGWTAQVINENDSAFGGSDAGLLMDAAGNIFSVGASTVFELSPNGGGGWTPAVIHTFTGAPKDGSAPQGTLVLDSAGNLYGTTTAGGTKNYGTVFKLSPGKKGWTEKILYSFKGGPKDGAGPFAGIAFDAAGNIYGTTVGGGKHEGGTVFELVAPVGTSKVYKEKVLWGFGGDEDGANPYGSLILDSAGNLYGTTYVGGPVDGGVVFEVNPSAAVTTATLSSSPNPSTYGEAVAFTAVVTPAPPDGETISFIEGKTVLATGALSGGSAGFTTSTLKVGTTSVKAVYGGDFYFLGSKSNTVKQVVEKAVE